MSGLLFIVSAPSGAGKTTLVRHLLRREPDISLSVSTTTRKPRTGEVDGRDYRFIDEASFRAQIKTGNFLEWANVHGNYYGTSRQWIEEAGEKGIDTLLEIDWQGAEQVRKAMPDKTVGIFVLPPSLEALAARLAERGTDSPEVIQKRLLAAREEIRHAQEFEYVIINDVLETALDNLIAIVRASRLTYARQKQRHNALFTALDAANLPPLT
ncbi:MAG: guanylate kinase [Betaproteobacteria bacterium]|nr:guanylate kinase [Betaproteobacteria bacterium]